MDNTKENDALIANNKVLLRQPQSRLAFQSVSRKMANAE